MGQRKITCLFIYWNCLYFSETKTISDRAVFDLYIVHCEISFRHSETKYKQIHNYTFSIFKRRYQYFVLFYRKKKKLHFLFFSNVNETIRWEYEMYKNISIQNRFLLLETWSKLALNKRSSLLNVFYDF